MQTNHGEALFFFTWRKMHNEILAKQACKQGRVACDLSHSAGDTTSALNRVSAFNLDFALMDWARFSKSSYHGGIKYSVKKGTESLYPKK
jgi:hypothetical protein